MLDNMSFHQKDTNKYKSMSEQDKKEIDLHLLNMNINREVILCFILLAIDCFLILINLFSTKGWSREIYIYGHFSYMHIMLIVIPLAFLVAVYDKRLNKISSTNYWRTLHLLINFLVLLLSSVISVYNSVIDKSPYPYIIAMFCIAPTVMLCKKERIFVYISSYIIYIIGCAVTSTESYFLIRNVFFVTLLIISALIVSYMQYASYLNDLINNKIISDKNKELDKLYKEAEETLKQRTEQLNETMEYEKFRAAFFANISHELRTPLTVIFSAEQMLDLLIKNREFKDGYEDMEQYMKVIKQNCYRLIRLVANLIDITKFDAGYLNINLKNYNIIKIVEDITLSVAKFIEDRNIKLIFDTEIEELVIACDPDKIERIVLNLLSNAVKFTPNGGSIYVNIYEKGGFVDIHVKDTGIGIPKAMQKSIFEPFIQVDKTISRSHEGSGIGLSIVKSLVDMHQGAIVLISEEGKGSEFIIKLHNRVIDDEEIACENILTNDKQKTENINIEFSDIYE